MTKSDMSLLSYVGLAVVGGLVVLGIYSDSSNNQEENYKTPTRQVTTLREGDVVEFDSKQYIVGQNDAHNPVLNLVLERPDAEGDLELKVEK